MELRISIRTTVAATLVATLGGCVFGIVHLVLLGGKTQLTLRLANEGQVSDEAIRVRMLFGAVVKGLDRILSRMILSPCRPFPTPRPGTVWRV